MTASTALEILNYGYRKANLTQLTAFSTTAEFPRNIGLDIINDAIQEMNRWGSYWFMETDTALTYGVGVSSYTLASLLIEPTRIVSVRRTLTDNFGKLTQLNDDAFTDRYRSSAMLTTKPTHYSKYGGVLNLDCIPDQDYSLKVKHYKDIPLIAAVGDTTPIPNAYEDVIKVLCYAYLLQAIGKADWADAYAVAQKRAQSLLVEIKEDIGLPAQMPRLF